MSSFVMDADRVPRRTHLFGLVTVLFGILLGLGAFAWVAGAGAAQTAWLAPARPSAISGTSGVPVGLVERSDNRGQVLFGRYCDSCHPGGGAGIGSDLESTQVKRQYTSDDRVIKLVRTGGFDMPRFDTSLLSDDDLANVATYVRNLPTD
jgi:mono/diheme cytochrome c family protein